MLDQAQKSVGGGGATQEGFARAHNSQAFPHSSTSLDIRGHQESRAIRSRVLTHPGLCPKFVIRECESIPVVGTDSNNVTVNGKSSQLFAQGFRPALCKRVT